MTIKYRQMSMCLKDRYSVKYRSLTSRRSPLSCFKKNGCQKYPLPFHPCLPRTGTASWGQSQRCAYRYVSLKVCLRALYWKQPLPSEEVCLKIALPYGRDRRRGRSCTCPSVSVHWRRGRKCLRSEVYLASERDRKCDQMMTLSISDEKVSN